MSKRALAIISARGGSKRIPRKNIRPFAGKPILCYPVEAALQAGCFDTVMVSTDDAEIAQISQDAGAEVPFLRFPETAHDSANLVDVLAEVLNRYETAGKQFDQVCLILPTAPFLTGEKLLASHRQLQPESVDAVVPVVRYSFPIQRAFQISDDGQLSMVWPEHMFTHSQQLPPRFHDCGQFYWVKTERFRQQGKLFMNHTVGFELPESEVQDIDTEEDWKVAEIKFGLMSPEKGQEAIRA